MLHITIVNNIPLLLGCLVGLIKFQHQFYNSLCIMIQLGQILQHNVLRVQHKILPHLLYSNFYAVIGVLNSFPQIWIYIQLPPWHINKFGFLIIQHPKGIINILPILVQGLINTIENAVYSVQSFIIFGSSLRLIHLLHQQVKFLSGCHCLGHVLLQTTINHLPPQGIIL